MPQDINKPPQKAYRSVFQPSKQVMIRYFLPLLLLCSIATASAKSFYIPITKFHTGASFITKNFDMKRGERTVPIGKSKSIITKIAYIDAPRQWHELRFESWYSLVRLCHGKKNEFTPHGYDQLGHMNGTLTCDGVDVTRKQLEQGFAWVIKRPQSGADLCAIEAKARAAKKGIWSLPSKDLPWNDTHNTARISDPAGKPACQ